MSTTASSTPSTSPSSGFSTTREDVCFDSAGQRCDGWLYRPAPTDGGTEDGTVSGSYPCLVMAHGLGGIRTAVLPDIAQRFAAAGIAVLVFDYRHSGTSEGQPRGLIDIGKQRDDYHAAVNHARCLDRIDPRRIALWGTSFSGGHVVTIAAEDPELAAAIIQNPFVDGPAATAATIRSTGRARAARLAWTCLRDQLRGMLGLPPLRVALVGEPGQSAMMTTPDAAAGYRSILPTDLTGWEPTIPARIILRLRHDRPGLRARSIRCPLLVCVCDHDQIAPPSPAVRVATEAPHGQLRRYPIGHFDLFTDPWLDQVIEDQITFLQHALTSAARGQQDTGSQAA